MIRDRMAELQRGGRVLLDANLLLLLTVGSFDRTLIKRFKRTESFATQDYDLLVTVLATFRTLVTTPNILTEVSNLANALDSRVKPEWSRHFAAQINLFVEVYEESRSLALDSLFPEFGLTDVSIARVTRDTLVLTQDGRLASHLNARFVCALDLKHLAQIRARHLASQP